jgi:hypothetical protein
MILVQSTCSASSSAANCSYRQKFYKLKKEAEKLLAANADGAAPATPAPAAKAPAKTPGKSTGKRKAAAATGDAEADHDATPTKRSKKTAASKIKSEPVVRDDDDKEVKSEGESGDTNGNNGEATAATGGEAVDGANEIET